MTNPTHLYSRQASSYFGDPRFEDSPERSTDAKAGSGHTAKDRFALRDLDRRHGSALFYEGHRRFEVWDSRKSLKADDVMQTSQEL